MIVLDLEELQLLQQQKSRTGDLKNTVAGEPRYVKENISERVSVTQNIVLLALKFLRLTIESTFAATLLI
jgi:hypothetical protein